VGPAPSPVAGRPFPCQVFAERFHTAPYHIDSLVSTAWRPVKCPELLYFRAVLRRVEPRPANPRSLLALEL